MAHTKPTSIMQDAPPVDSTPYGFPAAKPDDAYLRRRIREILQQQIDDGMYGELQMRGEDWRKAEKKKKRGGAFVGGAIVGGSAAGGRADNVADCGCASPEEKALEREILKERSVKELRKDAKDLGIKGYSMLDKKALIRKLMKEPSHSRGDVVEIGPAAEKGFHPFIEKKKKKLAKYVKQKGGADVDPIVGLNRLTIVELKALAKKMGIRGYSNKRKYDLVAMLEKYA